MYHWPVRFYRDSRICAVLLSVRYCPETVVRHSRAGKCVDSEVLETYLTIDEFRIADRR